eukprot:GHVQ01025709.1.p1 GENE.GHVQ01025709.1~~GHVQ01025709.1.p1  ORF type:complete len:117 (-),score=2.76 GHVQ01025709.1:123-473(-)
MDALLKALLLQPYKFPDSIRWILQGGNDNPGQMLIANLTFIGLVYVAFKTPHNKRRPWALLLLTHVVFSSLWLSFSGKHLFMRTLRKKFVYSAKNAFMFFVFFLIAAVPFDNDPKH